MKAKQTLAAKLLAQREARGEALDRVKAVIDADPAAPHRMSSLARVALMGQWHFQHSFEARFGVSPGRYVRLKRLRLGCELLESTDHQVIRIGSDVGYAHLSSFTNVFKRELGMAPTAYRRWARYAAELGAPKRP